MPKKLSIYLKDEKNRYPRFAWVHNFKPNEMMLGIYGLDGRRPTLRCMWSERDVTTEELPAIRYEFKDRIEVGSKIDHITCHADGKFHVKTVDNVDRYIQRDAAVRTARAGHTVVLRRDAY
jgi:hypothetical protein